MSKAQDPALNCESYLGIATDGSAPPPGSGNFTMYEFKQNPATIGNATYTSSSITISIGACKWTLTLANTVRNVENSSGLIKINATKITGPADPCYTCSNFVYWYLWSAVGDISWVTLSTTPSEPCYVSLYKVTPGSTLEKGNFSIFQVVKDRNEMSPVGPEYGLASYSRTHLSMSSRNCAAEYQELLAATVNPAVGPISSVSQSISPTSAPSTTAGISPTPPPSISPTSAPSTTAGISPTPPPSTPAATTPAQVTSQFQVKLSLLFQVSLAAFTDSTKQTLKEQMAVTAGLTKADASRVSLSLRAARRRQLLAESVAVDVTINMPDAASASKAAGQLTPAAISTALSSANLPAATVTTQATVAGSATALSPGYGPMWGLVAALAAALAADAAAWM